MGEVREVKVVPYDFNWPILFSEEAESLEQILVDEVIAIHHIGSTSIPYMFAKPIIDVLVEVKDIQKIDSYNEQLTNNGYIPKGENGIPGRRYLIKGTLLHRSHHIHMFQTGDQEIERHLTFRDYLKTHPVEANQYAVLKQTLAQQYPTNIEEYIKGKHDLIQEIDQRAKAWKEACRGTI
ncbi:MULTISPECIES: GrpB family protein [unclassified Rummeliibacillus]|mgnify:CR=1 FL=1|uniref:GrpB family protein n=1 Tax=unclassified Rummeliibacillus TaxID=2622809 RepID=UPI000E667FE3|nr:GrpB family protein [Rummeliibacillus sp. POC4]RPJ96398.1 GrpB family protein [Rummeliibacillus sp. TYF005]